MKSYTDLEQSKKLAKFLPIESADMRYGYIAPYYFSDRMYDGGYDKVPYPKDFLKLCANFCEEGIYDGSLPCWSLSALLNIINNNYYTSLYHDGVAWNIEIIHHDNVKDKHSVYAGTPIDACYEMIIRLNEQNTI